MLFRYPTWHEFCWSRRRRIAWIFGWKSPNCSSRQLLRSGRSDENGSSSTCCPGQNGSFSLSTFKSPVKSYLEPRDFPVQTRSSRCSKHCWPCALSAPTAVEAYRFYLGNLGVPVSTVFEERHFDPELLPHAVADLIQDLRRGAASPKQVVFAGRNLYVALRDEVLSDIVALNRSLSALLGTLFRLAARGHWIREKRPLPTPQAFPATSPLFEPSSAGPFEVTASVSNDGELELHLAMHNRGVRCLLKPYPEIRELEAILRHLEPGQTLDGVHFFASGYTAEKDGQTLFSFRRRSDDVLFTFSDGDWCCLKDLFSAALEKPELRLMLDRLSLKYGET